MPAALVSSWVLGPSALALAWVAPGFQWVLVLLRSQFAAE